MTKPVPIFAQNTLDRMDHLRPSVQPDAGSHFILIAPGGVAIRRADKNCLFNATEITAIPHDGTRAVFLGSKQNIPYFAVPVAGAPTDTFEVIDVRSFVAAHLLPDADLAMVAEGVSILTWHDTHSFCSHCGHKTISAHAGWRRDCPNCGRNHFPRTDPVVIMLVTHGDYCLLGSGRNFQDEKRYSCLAGFMEPGETIENAAIRELFEEAGVTAKHVDYLFSQPWPFPSNLMIGVHVQAESKEISMDEKELRDVKWVARADVEAVLGGATDRGFNLPPRIAVARNLLEHWLLSAASAIKNQ